MGIRVIVIGAGPAGLATAIKLKENNVETLVIEKENKVGGISKTKEYKGYRFDLGGHRFFTKSKDVNDIWDKMLGEDFMTRSRSSRIYYKNNFFLYPIKLFDALKGLGFWQSALVGFSYAASKLFPYKEEKTFEQWVSNRFGKRLFNIFFKTYTEKLWGIPCSEIQAEWAVQRIRGLSFSSAIRNAVFPDRNGKIKTLLSEFKYPRLGPGMMYEKMADKIKQMNGRIMMESEVDKVNRESFKVMSVEIKDKAGKTDKMEADYFVSSMPITELIEKLDPKPPQNISEAARNLAYRSFLSVNVILKGSNFIPDNWIYIHSPEVKLGRIQNYKKWSPYMAPGEGCISLGLEYFCNEGDEFWLKPDEELIEIAVHELEIIGLGEKRRLVDGFVIRVPKSYPVYDSKYPENMKIIRAYLDNFKNLQPIGRYGMFKYNNMDHSILTGFYAAENILGAKHNIWEVNVDQEYQEEKKDAAGLESPEGASSD